MGLKIKHEDVIFTLSRYEPYAYPIYNLDYRKDISPLIDFMNKKGNLILCGRQGLFRYNNMDQAIKMGFLASEVIAEGIEKKKILLIGESPDYLESYSLNEQIV